jgi:thioredoxin-related protein
MFELKKAENNRLYKVSEEIEDAVIKSQMASMIHLGKKLSFENLKKFYPEKEYKEDIPKKPKLVLIFSELGCNVCQDDETKFAVDFNERCNENFVYAVVHANNMRYVRNYIRLNRVNFPVYFCQDDAFFNDNNITNTPMIFIVDDKDRIIASHFPLPGHPEYSEPIHQFCFFYFEQYSTYNDTKK